VQETPNSTVPVQETPNSTVPVQETPNSTVPVQETPNSTVPVQETPSAFVVTMAVSLPFTLAEFDETKQTAFRGVIANVAGVKLTDVAIAGISSSSAVARRRLLAPALRIDLRVNAASSSAAGQMGSSLSNPATLNNALSAAGLPAATILVAAATTQTNNSTNTSVVSTTTTTLLERIQNPYIIAGAVGFVALTFAVILMMNTKSTHTPMTQSFPQFVPITHGAQLSQFANIPNGVQGTYYPIHDQSGQVTWHT